VLKKRKIKIPSLSGYVTKFERSKRFMEDIGIIFLSLLNDVRNIFLSFLIV